MFTFSVQANGHAFLVVSSAGTEVRRIDVKAILNGEPRGELSDDILGLISVVEEVPTEPAAKGYLKVPVVVTFDVRDSAKVYDKTVVGRRRISSALIELHHVRHDGSHQERRAADHWSVHETVYEYIKEGSEISELVA